MPLLDELSNRIVANIVYDGMGMAGKTTNLAQLCTFFTDRRRGELYTPQTINDRTAYFDWLRLDAGLVMGRWLRCHLYSVPGQTSLWRRRARILDRADVVVFVVDSTRSGIARARDRFRRLCEFAAGRSLPLVVQANKQDAKAALGAEQVLAELNPPTAVPVVGAQANDSVGVRETAVIAIRSAADAAQAFLLEHGFEGLAPLDSTPDDLLEFLRGDDPDVPLGAALELLDDGLPPAPTVLPLPEPAPQILTVVVGDDPTVDCTETENGLEPVPEAETDADVGVRPIARVATMVRAPWPSATVPSGFIWPGKRGREVLAALDFESARPRPDLIAQPGHSDGSGRDDVALFELDGWCLKTSARRRYADSDDARTALAHLARAKISLGPLLMNDTILTLAPGDDDCLWLWTLAPWRASLRASMRDADNDLELASALQNYATAVVDSIELAANRGLVLDVHPSNFAATPDGLFYLDDDILLGSKLPAIGHAILQRVSEYSDRVEVVESYLARLEQQLEARLPLGTVQQLGIADAIARASAGAPAAIAARRRLLDALASAATT